MSKTIGSIYEFVSKTGISYIGTLESVSQKTYSFTDVVMVSMRPMQLPDGNTSMAPAMDMVGIFVSNPIFTIPSADIYMKSEITAPNFINMYRSNIDMYNSAKQEHSALAAEEGTDISVQRQN